MKIHQLQTGAVKAKKRVGRGIGSGYGKTAGRGTKGQNSRSGGGVRPGFEGGQNPLAKRLPKKRGFTPVNRVKYATISLVKLEKLKAGNVTVNELYAAGMVKNIFVPVKLLGTGVVTKKYSVRLQAATSGAKKAIENAGGSFTVEAALPTPKRPSSRNRSA